MRCCTLLITALGRLEGQRGGARVNCIAFWLRAPGELSKVLHIQESFDQRDRQRAEQCHERFL